MRCCYLGMDDLTGYVSDAHLSVPAMEALGWTVEHQPWRSRDVDWSTYDLVYICTPWDYHRYLDDFLSSLERIDAAGPLVYNAVDVVRWNATKTYLADLERKGIAIVPSRWFDNFDATTLSGLFQEFESTQLVIKPTVGASALDTYVLTEGLEAGMLQRLEAAYVERPFFVQPFVSSVQTLGEYSMFFFDGDYSHSILKVPAAGDFRTQEEHGSDIQTVEPGEQLMLAARAVLAAVDQRLPYARVDFVLDADEKPLLMELELIEPSLYFRTDPQSPARFARAITKRFQREARI